MITVKETDDNACMLKEENKMKISPLETGPMIKDQDTTDSSSGNNGTNSNNSNNNENNRNNKYNDNILVIIIIN